MDMDTDLATLREGPLSYPITGGYVLIDRGDLALIEAYKWSIQNDGRGKEFALATCRATGKKRSVRMHRLILDATEGQLVDHVNGNTLDNRRSNLRLATAADNQRNKDHAESESGYKGVHKKKRGGWDASLSVGGVPHRLGSYASPAEAALVRDLAALELHGEFASTNYPTEVLQRIVTAEARLGEARQECARLRRALEKIKAGARRSIAYRNRLPFVVQIVADVDNALVAGPGSEQSSLTESGSAGLPDTPADSLPKFIGRLPHVPADSQEGKT